MLRRKLFEYFSGCRCIGEEDDVIFRMIDELITNVALVWSDSGAELSLTFENCLRVSLVAGKPKERMVQPGLPCGPGSCYLNVNSAAPLNFEPLYEEHLLQLSKQYLYCVIFHMLDYVHRELGMYDVPEYDGEDSILAIAKKEKRCACETLTPRI